MRLMLTNGLPNLILITLTSRLVCSCCGMVLPMVFHRRRQCQQMSTHRRTRIKEPLARRVLSGLVRHRNSRSSHHRPMVRLLDQADPGQTAGVASGISTRHHSLLTHMLDPGPTGTPFADSLLR